MVARRRPEEVPRPRRKPLRFVFVVGIAIAVMFGVDLGIRLVQAPWSFGIGGRPTLTGAWEGPRRARLGTEFRLFVELDYVSSNPSDSYELSDNLLGEARLCSPTGDVWVYRLTGRANRSADAISLDFGTPSDGPQMPTPGRVRARWDGGEALTIAGGFNPLMPDGSFLANRTVSSDDPDDSFVPATLVRSDRAAFEEACRALRRPRR